MKKKVLISMVSAMVVLAGCGANNAEAPAANNTTSEVTETETSAEAGVQVSNALFTITLPADCEGIYEADVTDEQITIFDKAEMDAGFGGMAFTVWARKLPSEFAGGPYVKKGELTDADGNKYEVVLGYATEVQWDYERSEEAPADYDKLYNAAEDVVKNMVGANGATFEYEAGTKGEDLYGDIVAKYAQAVEEGWDATKYEDNGMSAEFFGIAQTDGADGIGIAYYDVNLDGIDDLFVGTIKDDELKGTAYDVYTMVDGVPTHVVSGGARDRYYAYESFLVNEYSGGAMENGQNVYNVDANSTELTLQFSTKYDGYENEEQPWFICYSDEEWENVSEDDYNTRRVSESDYAKLDFKPLSEVK